MLSAIAMKCLLVAWASLRNRDRWTHTNIPQTLRGRGEEDSYSFHHVLFPSSAQAPVFYHHSTQYALLLIGRVPSASLTPPQNSHTFHTFVIIHVRITLAAGFIIITQYATARTEWCLITDLDVEKGTYIGELINKHSVDVMFYLKNNTFGYMSEEVGPGSTEP